MNAPFQSLSLEKYRALLIDIDNTLYAYEPCNQVALKTCYQDFIRTPGVRSTSEADFQAQYKNYRTLITNRYYPKAICRSRALAFLEYFMALELPDAQALSLRFENTYWDSFIAHMRLFPSALTLLQEAKKAELTVVAVTDMTTDVQLRKLSALGVSEYIDHVVTSEIAGIEKPSPVIFSLALQKAGVSASEAIMVGDDLEKDIKGAHAMGIKAFQVIASET